MKSVIKILAIVLVLVGILLTYYKTVIQKNFLITNTDQSVEQ